MRTLSLITLGFIGPKGYELIGVTAARARNDSFVGVYTPLDAIQAYLKVALPDAVAAVK